VHIFGATKARMRFVGHHLAHALSAYAYSGFEDAAVVVMDGRGAWEATSIWHGRDGRIEHVLTIPFPDSVGYFYSEFTEYLGFQRNSDEWKVMGLAPYGKPGVDLRAFIEPVAEPYKVNARNSLRMERRHLQKWCGCSGRGGFLRAKSTSGTKMWRMRCRMLARSR
jgi:carbamoyltransferase